MSVGPYFQCFSLFQIEDYENLFACEWLVPIGYISYTMVSLFSRTIQRIIAAIIVNW